MTSLIRCFATYRTGPKCLWTWTRTWQVFEISHFLWNLPKLPYHCPRTEIS